MTEQTNAELIAELRGFAAGSESARATLMRDAAAALEAAEQRAADAEVQAALNYGAAGEALRAAAQRDQYAAVVEKVRQAASSHWEYQTRREAKFGREGSSCVCAVCDIMRALTAAPADTLREHDGALIEAYQSQIRSTIGAFGDADGVWAFDSAVKTVEEARQRREEQS